MDYIYLDNAATSFPKPQCVIDSVSAYLSHIGASPARSAHSLSIASGQILYEARVALAKLLGQSREERVIFGANATMMLNSALYGILQENDRVVTTSLEHNSVIRQLMELKNTRHIQIEIIQSSPTCAIYLSHLESALQNARVCVCVYANNVSGAVLPIAEIYTLCKKYGVIFILDSSQAIGHLPLSANDADIICGSCHKGLYAPSSLGFMSLNPAFDENVLQSFMQGGTGSQSEEGIQPRFLPDKYESGTPNMCAIAGLRAALEWIEQSGGIAQIHARQMDLYRQLYEGLKSISSVLLYEIESPQCVANVSFNIINASPSQVGLRLDREFGILSRVGLHCSPLTHKSMGSFECGGSVRLSIGAFNTHAEIGQTLRAIEFLAKAYV